MTTESLLADFRLRSWYRQINKLAVPMRTDAGEGQALSMAARALLRADGSLGASVSSPRDRELAVGDHVRTRAFGAVDTHGEELPPPGVPGRIVEVDQAAGTVEVTFAIWGNHRLAGRGLDLLEHDYVEAT